MSKDNNIYIVIDDLSSKMIQTNTFTDEKDLNEWLKEHKDICILKIIPNYIVCDKFILERYFVIFIVKTFIDKLKENRGVKNG